MKFIITFVLTALLSAVSVTSLGQNQNVNRKFGANPHLVGATLVKPLHHQYAIGLRLSKDGEVIRQCGGARMSSHWFVTAAECLDEEKYDILRVVYPSYPEYQQREGYLKSLKYVVHPDYNPETKANNIAIFDLGAGSSWLSVLAQNILLARDDHNGYRYLNYNANVTAWIDHTDEPFHYYSSIHAVETTVIGNVLCSILSWRTFTIDNNHICASGAGGNELSESDLGVPLVVKTDENTIMETITLVGIGTHVTAPETKSTLPFPMIFTRISSYSDWIHDEMNK